MNEATAAPEIIVSFEDVKMKDFRAYWQAVARNDGLATLDQHKVYGFAAPKMINAMTIAAMIALAL